MNKNNELTEAILSTVKARGLKRVIVTGYSLGGAVAALYLLEAGQDLVKRGVDIRGVTFGCPRFIETKDAIKLPHSMTSRIFNVFVEGDPIPLDLTAILGFIDYSHVGNSMTIKDDGGGITLHEDHGLGESDSYIKWWGLRPPSGWDSHFSETYNRHLQMTEDLLLLKKQ